MNRSLRLSALLTVAAVFPLAGREAAAQFNVIEPGSTVHGELARGLGVFGAGAGIYNRATAEAMAINAFTAMQLNEYVWLCQQNHNLRYRNSLIAARARNVAFHHGLDTRLRANPQPRDIRTGDALNVLLGDLTRASEYLDRIPDAGTPIRCDLVRDIPLNHAPGGITVSLNELAQGAAPLTGRFPTGVMAVDPRRFVAFQTRAENDPEMTLADLIAFMAAFDLRFGVARTPSQREAYEALYPALSSLHKAAFGSPVAEAGVPPAPSPQ